MNARDAGSAETLRDEARANLAGLAIVLVMAVIVAIIVHRAGATGFMHTAISLLICLPVGLGAVWSMQRRAVARGRRDASRRTPRR